MIRKVLFSVDLSEDMNKITPYVLEMADKFEAEIYCVYCLHVTAYYSHIGMPTAYITDFETKAGKEVEKKLATFIENNFKNRSVHSEILHGRPGDEIVQYAESHNMDLIIMGHSTTGIQRAIIGSVAGYVVKNAPAPVLVISPEVLNA